MDFEVVKAWYTESVNRRIGHCRLLGILGLVLMPLALALACGLLFCLLWVASHRQPNPPAISTCLWISLALIPLMFLLNLAVPRKNFLDRHVEEGTRAMRGEVYAQVFLWILLAGPMLVDWSLNSFREIKWLRERDVHSCAAVLWVLISHYKRVSYEEIQAALPWLDMQATIPVVLTIPGVIQLRTPPEGLSLHQEMREAMCTRKHD